MEVDINHIRNTILDFCDYRSKKILHVECNNGELIPYALVAKQVYAIDSDPKNMDSLLANITKNNLGKKIFPICLDFGEVEGKFDLIIFEFCLHKVKNISEVLRYAKHISDRVMIMEYGKDSMWPWYMGIHKEINKVYDILSNEKVLKIKNHTARQKFSNYDDLYENINSYSKGGQVNIADKIDYRNFDITMYYNLILI